MTVKYKRNSPVLVMRITSVSQLLTCTKAPSMATAPFDSCHYRGAGINNIYKPKFPPTTVVTLLQYSGSRIEHKDEFSSYQMIYSRLKMVNLFWILGFCVKTVRVLMMKTENKLK